MNICLFLGIKVFYFDKWHAVTDADKLSIAECFKRTAAYIKFASDGKGRSNVRFYVKFVPLFKKIFEDRIAVRPL